ncbi:glycosyltransferase [Micromonospora yasonensis]|uniref:glycosyltransferase n=1 Tax=Micromonospora yasonensis TaxID=1128667 RepID=UPI0022323D11|nr:glycosyltransferase [Micromonospora yasonensis]MCW3840033.1 glycosyltransferase [Micromonospora yasonensis]
MDMTEQTPPVGQHEGLRALAGSSVALVHEWFGVTGGSEKVFGSIADLVPHAERFVLWKDRGVEEPALRESWLARTPLRHNKAMALPLMPMTWRTLTRRRFDVVISSSHAFAHTVKLGPPETTRHLSYVHAPARYLWSPAFDSRGSSPLLALPRRALQAVDVRFSRHVHSYAANSREVQARIRHYWQRDAVVVNPPVDVTFFSSAPAADRNQARDYLLGVGRWIPYKRFDLIIAIAEAAGLPVVIAGSGPEEINLRRLAERTGVPVTFEVTPSKERLRQLYWGAKALLFPVHEDFGIIPVEAQACGTPVIGINRGGLLETVVDGETGFLIDSADAAAFAAVLDRLDELDRDRVRSNASRFSEAAFAANFSAWVEDAVA